MYSFKQAEKIARNNVFFQANFYDEIAPEGFNIRLFGISDS
jgi:hypothetical protein